MSFGTEKCNLFYYLAYITYTLNVAPVLLYKKKLPIIVSYTLAIAGLVDPNPTGKAPIAV